MTRLAQRSVRLTPSLLAAACGLAAALPGQAQTLAPYALSLGESVSYRDNVYSASAGAEQADWQSMTTLQALLDQPLGRQRVKASAAVTLDRYASQKKLNNTGYRLTGAWDWSGAELLSGAVGAEASQQRRAYGLDADTPFDGLNIERNQRVFATVQLGGPTTWTFTGGLNGLRRSYSVDLFAGNEVRQWTADLGATYRANPDLSLSTGLHYTAGSLPHFNAVQGADDFHQTTLDLSGNWQVSGASLLAARLGYTQEQHRLQSDSGFWNGALTWTWVPTERLSLSTGLRRGNNAAQQAVTNALNFTTQYVTTAADLSANWALTSRTRLNATVSQNRRTYAQTLVGGTPLTGQDHGTSVGLGASFAPSEALQFSCSLNHERHSADSALNAVSRDYTSRVATCSGTVWLR